MTTTCPICQKNVKASLAYSRIDSHTNDEGQPCQGAEHRYTFTRSEEFKKQLDKRWLIDPEEDTGPVSSVTTPVRAQESDDSTSTFGDTRPSSSKRLKNSNQRTTSKTKNKAGKRKKSATPIRSTGRTAHRIYVKLHSFDSPTGPKATCPECGNTVQVNMSTRHFVSHRRINSPVEPICAGVNAHYHFSRAPRAERASNPRRLTEMTDRSTKANLPADTQANNPASSEQPDDWNWLLTRKQAKELEQRKQKNSLAEQTKEERKQGTKKKKKKKKRHYIQILYGGFESNRRRH